MPVLVGGGALLLGGAWLLSGRKKRGGRLSDKIKGGPDDYYSRIRNMILADIERMGNQIDIEDLEDLISDRVC